MKKSYLLLTASILIFASTIQLKAQCGGNRYHDFVFPGLPTVTSNIQYGSSVRFNNTTQNLMLDVYQPNGDTASTRALIIIAHGGSFVGGSKTGSDVTGLSKDFAKMGYVTASIDYRLFMTDLPFPGPDSNDGGAAVLRAVHDARAAVRYFRKNARIGGNTYKIDTNNIFFAGVSAGALTALHLAYMDQENEFPSYIDTTGITVGTKTGQPGLHGGIEGKSGNPGYSSKVKAVVSLSGALSDTAWMHAGDTPAFMTHGTSDGTVPYGTAIIYLQPPSTFPMQYIDGSSSVAARANQVGIVNCFRTYFGQGHVAESNAHYYDTTLVIARNFLEHFTCGIPLNCNYTTDVSVSDIAVTDVSINVYPNPANTSITVDLSSFSRSNVTVELFDAMGRKVRNIGNLKTDKYVIQRDNLPSGIYFLNILTNGKLYSKNVVFE